MRKSESVEEKLHQLWTVGHSTHSLDDFKLILSSQAIQTLADVRAYPVSRRYPHFNKEVLRMSLNKAGIRYEHLPVLGGRRPVSPNSRNAAWKNASFRAYADYMETAEFHDGVKELIRLSEESRTAVMCAEAVWWRCHRSLIADYMKVEGWNVTHILSAKKTESHPYTAAASIIDGKLSYRGLLSQSE